MIAYYIFLILSFLTAAAPAHAQSRLADGSYEFFSAANPGLKAVFPVNTAGLEKDIYIPAAKTSRRPVGIRALLISPHYPVIKSFLKNGNLSLETSKEHFIYSQAESAKTAVLKEWIIAPSPNTDFGSEYIWKISPIFAGDNIRLRQDGQKIFVSLRRRNSSVIARSPKGDEAIFYQQIAVIEPVIFWDRFGKKYPGRLSIDGNTVKVQVRAHPNQYPLRIDPALRYGQWLGGGLGSLASINAAAYDSSVGIVIGGAAGAKAVGKGDLHIGVAMNGVVNSIAPGFVVDIADGGTPSVQWGQWLGGGGNTVVSALALNGITILAGGYTTGSTSWTTVAFNGTYNDVSGNGEGFVVNIQSGSAPVLAWGQWLGGDSNTKIDSLAVNGLTILAGGYTQNSTSWETVAFHGTYSNGTAGASEGFVVNIQDGGTPSLAWGQWLGGSSLTTVSALGVNGLTILAGGYTQNSTSWETVAFHGTYSNGTAGASEGFVVNIQDGGTPSLAWGQWLGGKSNAIVNSLAVNGLTILAGGYTLASTSWETMTFHGTYSVAGGNIESFVVNIQDGGTPALAWGQWIGSANSTVIYSLTVNNSTILAGGYTQQSTSFETVAFNGTYGTAGIIAFAVNIQDGGTPALAWGQWLGGAAQTIMNTLAVNGSSVYVGGYTLASTSWETVTFQGAANQGSSSNGFMINIQDGGTPALAWGQWVGGGKTGATDTANVSALAVSGSTIIAGGFSEASNFWQNLAFNGTYNNTISIGGVGFVVNIQDGATPSFAWGQWLGGGSNTVVSALALNGLTIVAGGNTQDLTSWTTMTFHGTYSVATVNNEEGFVVNIQDGGTPALAWGQWMGGITDSSVTALAMNGLTILAGGFTQASTSWQTVAFHGTYSASGAATAEGFVVNIQDGGTPALAWGQWLGGNSRSQVNALAVNGLTILAGGTSTSSTTWETVTFHGTFSNLSSNSGSFVVNIQDGGTPAMAWGQWLGGANITTLNTLVVNGLTILAGGYTSTSTSWTTVTFHGTYSVKGNIEGFVVNIQDGGTPALAWGQWLGGASTSAVNALAVNGTTIYAGGYTTESTSWETVTFYGVYNDTVPASSSGGFVVNIQDGGTPSLYWGRWLGGNSLDLVSALAINKNTVYAGGYSVQSTSWAGQGVTFQGDFGVTNTSEGFVVSIAGGDAGASSGSDTSSSNKNGIFFDTQF